MKPEAWQEPNNVDSEPFHALSNALMTCESRNRDLITNLRDAEALFVLSDSSGSHHASPYTFIATLLIDARSIAEWLIEIRQVRKSLSLGNRRISFKGLNDRKKQSFLIPFLQCANLLKGNLIVVGFSKEIGAFVTRPYSHGDIYSYLRNDLGIEHHWKPRMLESLFRTTHLVSFLVAGLSRSMQDLYWFIDEDDIAPNRNGIIAMTEFFANVSSLYLHHMLRHMKFGTTASDDGSRSLEDLVSIPDLSAGASSEYLREIRQIAGKLSAQLIVPMFRVMPKKSDVILDWFSESSGHSLRKLLFIIDPATDNKVTVSAVQFDRFA